MQVFPNPVANHILVANGHLHQYDRFPAKAIDPRSIVVWLPDGYRQGERYPVLYMHDGQMLFQSTVTKNQDDWGVDHVANGLIRSGTIPEFIVVGIFNHDTKRALEYLPEKPLQAMTKKEVNLLKQNPDPSLPEITKRHFLADAYLRFLVDELKPFIDKTYSTKPDQGNTCLAGSSMGGLISWYALCEYPYVFGAAACLSTHWPGLFRVDNNPLPNHFLNYLKTNLPEPGQHRFYFDHGTEDLDALYGPFQTLADQIAKEKGYTSDAWTSNIFTGTGHAESDWRDRLHIPLIFLFQLE